MERFSSAEEFLDFYRDNLKEKMEKTSFVYGNSESAREVLENRDTWAVFSKLESPSHQKSRWALDPLKALEVFLEDPDTSNTYENSIEIFSATNLYAVTRAESNGEVGTESYNFHVSVLRSLEREEVQRKHWIEDIEYTGRMEGKEPEGDIQRLENQIANIEQEIEQKEQEIDSRDQQIEKKEQKIEEVERSLELYQTVISNSELLIEVFQEIEQINDELDHLDQVDGAIIRDLSDVDSRAEEAEEELDRRFNSLAQHYQGLRDDLQRLENNLEELYERTERFEDVEDEVSENLEDLENSVEDLEDRIEDTSERPVIVSEDISYSAEKQLEDLDSRLKAIEKEVRSTDQTPGLWDRISRFLPGTDKPGEQTTIDDWTE